MDLNELNQYSEIIIGLLSKSAVKINKWREKFMLEVLLLYLIIPGRINFLQLGRYGRFGEQRYRKQFSHKFDWLSFNTPGVRPCKVEATLEDTCLLIS